MALDLARIICPECAEKFNYDNDRTQKIPKNYVDDKTVPSICFNCKMIYKIDAWVVENGKKVWVTHGLCPACFKKFKDQIDEQHPRRQ